MKILFCGILIGILGMSGETRLVDDGHSLIRVVEIPAEQNLLESAVVENFPPLQKFREDVSAKTLTDPFYLLRRQRVLFETKFKNEVPVFDAVLDEKLGTIVPMRNLEAQLLEALFQFSEVPSEFQAFILRKKDSYRIYWLGSNRELTPPRTENVLASLLKDVMQEGWTFFSHLHNHPFIFDNPFNDIAGTLIPSGSDRTHMKNLQKDHGLPLPEEMWITNGFHTIVMSREEIQQLR